MTADADNRQVLEEDFLAHRCSSACVDSGCPVAANTIAVYDEELRLSTLHDYNEHVRKGLGL